MDYSRCPAQEAARLKMRVKLVQTSGGSIAGLLCRTDWRLATADQHLDDVTQK